MECDEKIGARIRQFMDDCNSKDKKMGVPDRMWAFFVNCVITWK